MTNGRLQLAEWGSTILGPAAGSLLIHGCTGQAVEGLHSSPALYSTNLQGPIH